jgi:hypothetical protein
LAGTSISTQRSDSTLCDGKRSFNFTHLPDYEDHSKRADAMKQSTLHLTRTAIWKMDLHYSVKGTAVDAVLDKVIATPKMEKPNDLVRIKQLYKVITELVMHYEFSKTESEMSSRKVLHTVENYVQSI